MTRRDYPLRVALEIRTRERDAAHDRLARCQRRLSEEQHRLDELESRRELARAGLQSAKARLYDAPEDGRLEIGEIDQRQGTIQFLRRRLAEFDRRMTDQEHVVAEAIQRVEGAREQVVAASRSLKVIETHRGKWLEERRRQDRKREATLLQEVATSAYCSAAERGDQ